MKGITISARSRVLIQMLVFATLVGTAVATGIFTLFGNWRAAGFACITGAIASAVSITFASQTPGWSRYATAGIMLLIGSYLIFA